MRITKWDKAAIVKAIMADVPKIDKDKRRKEMQEAVIKLMTPECRKVYKSMPDALRTYHVGGLIYNGHGYNSREIVRGDVPEKALKALEAKYEAEDKVVRDAEYSLKGAIEACTTLKQLNDRLPEFKKYFPTEQKPVANLPALANVVADLTKLGWPKK
jgi:hypothetical protein